MAAEATTPRRLRAQPLTAEAFAPFGSLATIDAVGGRSVNQARAHPYSGHRRSATRRRCHASDA